MAQVQCERCRFALLVPDQLWEGNKCPTCRQVVMTDGPYELKINGVTRVSDLPYIDGRSLEEIRNYAEDNSSPGDILQILNQWGVVCEWQNPPVAPDLVAGYSGQEAKLLARTIATIQASSQPIQVPLGSGHSRIINTLGDIARTNPYIVTCRPVTEARSYAEAFSDPGAAIEYAQMQDAGPQFVFIHMLVPVTVEDLEDFHRHHTALVNEAKLKAVRENGDRIVGKEKNK